jgi:predicted nucleic acid-binding protein
MSSLAPPLVTCEPVLTEATFLLQRNGGNAWDLVRKLGDGSLTIGIELQQEASAIHALMKRYADTPMTLADACMVRLSERYTECRLFTLDSDFEHYRRNGRQVIPLLFPG